MLRLSRLPVILFAAIACEGGRVDRETADLLITGGTVITMDSARRVIDNGAVAVVGDRIVAVGTTAELTAEFRAAEVIDATRKVVMPGLIDGHGHAGHGLVKTLGADLGRFNEITEKIYAHGSTPEFWRADALLTGLEKIRFGVTTSLVYFGGGDMVSRTDDPKYGDAILQAVEETGLRYFLAVGPRRPPFPRAYTEWVGDSSHETSVTFERQLEVTEDLINRWNGDGDGRIHIAVMSPTIDTAGAGMTRAELEEARREALATRALSREHGVLFTEDGHTTGTVKFADQLGILGPDVILSHATALTPEEVGILARTGTRISHNPSAIAAQRRPFLLTELLDAGVTVMLGSDGVAPDRSYDMLRHVFQAMRYHRARLHDPSVLPAGKALEMVTVDAAKALGLEEEIGSLEPGRKADIILIDMWRPHLLPSNMPVYRVAYFANGNDVSTVLVDGRVIMRDRRVLTVDEDSVLTAADREAGLAIRRVGLEEAARIPDGFWGRSRMPPR